MWPFTKRYMPEPQFNQPTQAETLAQEEAQAKAYRNRLAPYTTIHECSKCGSASASVKHNSAYQSPYSQYQPVVFLSQLIYSQDHLIVTCSNCGYQWWMKCRDAKEE